ncbi:hypothetical protein DKX38_010888 [Salix brachista]|uniref:Uncharacterized protein n=1 Tax=Salix brachista TaxID=2182728 RepID=A0A5N5LXY2_9ROSI|nr:hypothetical protein DKX38_010888 [Salix brachista]
MSTDKPSTERKKRLDLENFSAFYWNPERVRPNLNPLIRFYPSRRGAFLPIDTFTAKTGAYNEENSVCSFVRFLRTKKIRKKKSDEAGVKLTATGVGAPDKAAMLADRRFQAIIAFLHLLLFSSNGLPFYADPERKASDVLGLYYGFERTFFNPPSAKVFSRSYALRKAVKINTVEATQMIDGVNCNSSSAAPSALTTDIFEICCKVPVA